MEKLFSIVMAAFVWAYAVGIFVNGNIEKIKILKHGRAAKTLFKCGLTIIANILLNPVNKLEYDIFKFLSYT